MGLSFIYPDCYFGKILWEKASIILQCIFRASVRSALHHMNVFLFLFVTVLKGQEHSLTRSSAYTNATQIHTIQLTGMHEKASAK